MAEKKERGRVPNIPITVRTKAKNLYLNQCLPAKDIAAACEVSEPQIRWLIHKYGWARQRLDNEKRLVAHTDAKFDAISDEISTAIASECEEIALAGLARAKEAVKDTHKDAPKNYQAWTAGVRNLASARSIIKNNTAQSSEGLDTGARHLNLFFMGTPAKAEKRVAPTGDIADVL